MLAKSNKQIKHSWDGFKSSILNENLFYSIVQQTQLVVADADPTFEATCIVAPVAAVRRCSLGKIK